MLQNMLDHIALQHPVSITKINVRSYLLLGAILFRAAKTNNTQNVQLFYKLHLLITTRDIPA